MDTVALPILLPLAGASIALLLRKHPRLRAYGALFTMVASLLFTGWLYRNVLNTGQALTFNAGGWPAPFGITLILDPLSGIFILMAQSVMVMALIYTLGSRAAVINYPSFYTLFLTLATGLTGTFLTGDLFNLFVFAELLVISGTMLAALSDHAYGTEAAFKYFYISLLASIFMLLGIGGLYASYGTLNLADLANRIAVQGPQLLFLPAMALLLVTFMIKGAIFPFHFWQPDLYMTSTTPVAAVLAAVVSKLGVYGILRISTLFLPGQVNIFQPMLLLLGLIGVIYGGLSAIGTHDLKRMLAYSSMAQIGFIVIAIAWGTAGSLTAAVVYSFNHSLIKAALIMLAGYVASRTSQKSSSFARLTGMGQAVPIAGILFFIASLALAGIPLTNGFISKMLLFGSGIAAGEYWSLLLLGIASILTLIYTMRALMRIWWQKADQGDSQTSTGDSLLAPVLLLCLIVMLGIYADPLVSAGLHAADWLLEPSAYISAVIGE